MDELGAEEVLWGRSKCGLVRDQCLHTVSRGYQHDVVDGMSSSTLHFGGQTLNEVVHVSVVAHQLPDFLYCMENRSVISVADTLTNLR